MRLKLPEEWAEYLVDQPEAGMGYQRVTVVLDDDTRLEDRVVFNAEEIELPDVHAGKKIKDVRIRSPR